MSEITIRDALRQSHVKRWGMVQTSRTQTLAEHSYNVAMIAAEWCYRECYPREAINAIVYYALTHDMAEVVCGDVATPLKIAMKTDLFDKLDASLQFAGDGILPDDFAETCYRATFVLKLADLVDAAAFIMEYGQGEHARSVEAKLMEAINTHAGVKGMALLLDATSGKFNVLTDFIRG